MADNQRPEGNVDKQLYQASVSRLTGIFREMSETVNEVSRWRCPYKNVEDRCTANCGCKNQAFSEVESELPVCTGSDNLDYRSAWEV